jgi:hypothetical protein
MGRSKSRPSSGAAALDWLVHVYAPAFLRLAKLDDHAALLAGLSPITSTDQSTQVETQVSALCADIQKRCSQLTGAGEGLPADDPVWLRSVAAIRRSHALAVASEMWAVADAAAEIAIENGNATTTAVRERASELEQDLAQRLDAL